MRNIVPLELYEAKRGRRRTIRQLILSHHQRCAILETVCVLKPLQLQQATEAANLVKRQRTRALWVLDGVQEFCKDTLQLQRRRQGTRSITGTSSSTRQTPTRPSLPLLLHRPTSLPNSPCHQSLGGLVIFMSKDCASNERQKVWVCVRVCTSANVCNSRQDKRSPVPRSYL